ncbi:Arm DNA-binding domain-containing protein [Campylobacter lanienae]|uniref:Arm DNA-binding domain-containing protein n=1 Tax=Campylobacter lanienae TaxID=75658 RepID=UPI000BB44DA3|nr:Arm DNA-binding domain-containing protein [Campylobacter lanienae]
MRSTRNIIVRIRPNSKTFIFRIKNNDKIKKHTIGQYPLISLATTRPKSQYLDINFQISKLLPKIILNLV